MGLQPGGRLNQHLADLKAATLKWLEHENPLPRPDNSLLFEEWEPDEPVEQPETLSWLRQARRLNIPIVEGALWDMPFILLEEINTVIDTENEFNKMRETNLLLQAKALTNESK